MEGALTRVLIANRGEVARRLIRYFRQQGVETVAVFSEPEVEQVWVDEADYAVYLNGRTVSDTYLDGDRLVAAAQDAACDVIHPGYCFLAERPDFHRLAASANLGVVGPGHKVLETLVDRTAVRQVARELEIPMIPASGALGVDEDGVESSTQVGFPLMVKAVSGGALQTVTRFEDLGPALSMVRQASLLVTGDPRVFFERRVDSMRHCAMTVVADAQGEVVCLGPSDSSLEVNFRSWVEELGTEVPGGELGADLAAASVALTRRLGFVGVGRVRWAITPNGGWYLLGLSGRLTTGFDLVEAVYGVDLVHTQMRLFAGEALGWEEAEVRPRVHGLQLRLFHVGPHGRGRPDGTLTRLEVPEGVQASVGVEEGQVCTAQTEPLIVKLTVTAPTRQAAIVKARHALSDLVIEGVSTNREVLLRLLAEEQFWNGAYDTTSLSRFVSE